MKHLLNNLSEEEKNSIREQHEGGMKVNTENFKSLLESKLGNAKPLIIEQSTTQKNIQTITNKVATEGIKNVTPEMITAPQFKATYSGYVFGGVFNDINYQWDCNGVEDMSGVRGVVDGEVLSETLENVSKAIKKTLPEGKPGSICVGFVGGTTRFVIYTTNSGKPTAFNF